MHQRHTDTVVTDYTAPSRPITSPFSWNFPNQGQGTCASSWYIRRNMAGPTKGPNNRPTCMAWLLNVFESEQQSANNKGEGVLKEALDGDRI